MKQRNDFIHISSNKKLIVLQIKKEKEKNLGLHDIWNSFPTLFSADCATRCVLSTEILRCRGDGGRDAVGDRGISQSVSHGRRTSQGTKASHWTLQPGSNDGIEGLMRDSSSGGRGGNVKRPRTTRVRPFIDRHCSCRSS
jgi:hypothetical protein